MRPLYPTTTPTLAVPKLSCGPIETIDNWQDELRKSHRWVQVSAWFVGIAGLLASVQGVFPKVPNLIRWSKEFLPLDIWQSNRLGMCLFGVAMLAIARGLRRRKRAAWWIAVTVLSLASVLELIRASSNYHFIPALAVVGILLGCRRRFLTRSDPSSVRCALFVGIPMFIAVFLCGVLGLVHANGQAITWEVLYRTLLTSFGLIFSRAASSQVPITLAANFFEQVSVGGMFSGLLIVLLLLRPVRRSALESNFDHAKIREIIERHGCDSLDEFALLPDKRYVLSRDGRSFFAYVLWRNLAVCLVGPVGPVESWLAAVKEFIAFCAMQDWEPIFYCARAELRPILRECGIKSIKIGEDARLTIKDFSLKGSKFQNLRTACNKARKEGKIMRWYQPGDGQVDHGLEAQLKILSDSWLKDKKGAEMSFDLGAFNLPQIRRTGVAAILSSDGRLEAFVTWLPYKQGRGRSLDLMRRQQDAKNVMDFLIVESISHFRTMGVEEVSLGNALLANVKESLDPYGCEERAIKFLFDNFNRYYRYKSLFEFKKKYQPVWQGRYLGFRPTANRLLVPLALLRVHMPQGMIRILGSIRSAGAATQSPHQADQQEQSTGMQIQTT
jgi:lysylphosphatidylglycerol synthetase-like protein (DUF2156 family)